jgi:hypothetical protein
VRAFFRHLYGHFWPALTPEGTPRVQTAGGAPAGLLSHCCFYLISRLFGVLLRPRTGLEDLPTMDRTDECSAVLNLYFRRLLDNLAKLLLPPFEFQSNVISRKYRDAVELRSDVLTGRTS